MIESGVNSFSSAYPPGISVLSFSGDAVFERSACAGISKDSEGLRIGKRHGPEAAFLHQGSGETQGAADLI
jgi:hypothetical protein